MRPLLILKTGSTLPGIAARRGDFEAWIEAGLGPSAGPIWMVRVDTGGTPPDPADLRGAVVTGSPAMVSAREPWSEGSAAWLAEAAAAGLPILGICYGHQLLAHGLRAPVGPNPLGREIGTVALHLHPEAREDLLLGGLASPSWQHATHQESVLALPEGARLLASSEGDPHAAFAWGERAWGVQIHPEFDADVMRGYIEGRRPDLEAEGLDPEALLAGVRETPDGTRILRRFAALCARTPGAS